MKIDPRILVFGLGMASLGMVGGAGLSALAGPGGYGEHRPRPRASMPGMKLVHGISRLDDLTDEQRGMLKRLHTDTRTEMKELHAERANQHAVLRDALLADGVVDRVVLHAELDSAAAEKLELAHAFLDRVLDIRDTLTADQLAGLREMAAEHRGHGPDRH